ncbi:MAG: glycosyl hydrolase, partial [Chloroflexales bacterium]|nr:glycosyl hydrolase [Chloroflexales bacterium]
NPNVLYAAMYDKERLPWQIIESGPESGVYRSDNGGAAWTWLNDDKNFLVRSWYFTHLVPDPANPDTLYMPGRKLWKSGDAGRSCHQLNTPYVDQHDLWVDPHDTRRMIVANDGGAAVSRNAGLSWSSIVNQPTAELYHVAADTQFPYRVYTSQQDNSTLSLPSRSDRGPIAQSDWYDVGGGESGFVAVRPDNPNIVFSGDLPGLGITRYDHRTRQIREICPWGELDGATADGGQYRFNWSTPIVLSPHQPHALYVAGNVLWRSDDEGASWQVISPDLTRNERALLERSGGSPTGENSVANDYCTISTFAESPLAPGLLWAGTDDGLVHLLRDGGASWVDITPPDMPEWATTCVEASPHDAGAAYLSATAHQRDDFAPYIWRTADYGATWQRIDSDIPQGEFVRVVRSDPRRPGLLFCGTEAGVFYSPDDGATWHPLQRNLPHVAVYDLLAHEGDLLVATHGRGLWAIDDLSPLYHQANSAAVTLLPPRPTVRLTRQCYGLESLVALYNPFVAANPPAGVVVDYALPEDAGHPITLELLDGAGAVVSALSSTAATAEPRPIGAYDYA